MFQPQTNRQFLLSHITQTIDDQIWRVKKVNIPAQSKHFNAIIEGVKGTGFQGDAAIDDIKLYKGTCK